MVKPPTSTFLGTFILFASNSALSLDVRYSSINPHDGSRTAQGEVLLLEGQINPGDYDRVLKVVGQDTTRFWRSGGFVIASPGGDIQESIRIATLVRGTYRQVAVGKASGPCISACFFIYAAAATRMAGSGTIGIHRPYIDPERMVSLSLRDAEIFQKAVFAQARAYLEDLQVPTNMIDTMFRSASTEVHWLSDYQLNEELGRRPPWYEQFLIEHCNLDKELERTYFATADESLISQIIEVEQCGQRLGYPEAEENLQNSLRMSTTP